MTSSEFTDNRSLKPPIRRTPSSSSPCAACTVRDLAVCSVLEGDELDQLNAIMIDVNLSKGDYLFHQGDEANLVFNIAAGAMQLSKLLPDGRRQVTGFLFGGDFLGLVSNREYTCSAEAITDVRLCKFRRLDLQNLFRDFPKMETRLLSMARNELAETQDQILMLGRKTSVERVASFLLKLSDRAVTRGESGNPVPLPMGRHGLGDYLGLTTESVSRALTRLKNKQIISDGATKQNILILDRNGLQELTGDL